MAALPLAKLGGLLIKQLAKPVSTRLQVHAKSHPAFRSRCAAFGQWLHMASVRIVKRGSSAGSMEYVVDVAAAPCIRIVGPVDDDQPSDLDRPSEFTFESGQVKKGKVVRLVEDPAVVKGLPNKPREALDSFGKTAQLVYWHNNQRGSSHQRTRERQYAWVPAKVDGTAVLQIWGVKPLPEDEAVNTGAVFMGEAFVFGIGAIVFMTEYLRQNSKQQTALDKKALRRAEKAAALATAAHQRDLEIAALKASLASLECKVEALTKELREEHVPQRRRSWWWS